MWNSEQLAEAERLLNELRDRLRESRIRAEIDEPIDEALAASHIPGSCPTLPWTAGEFDDFLIGLVQTIHRRGCRLHACLSRADALAEAVRLLDRHYGLDPSCGYDMAVLEAEDGDEGLGGRIAACLAEAVKDEQREIYRHWVLATAVETLDWDMKCAVVAVYFATNRESLSGAMTTDCPGRFAEHVGELISRHATTVSTVHSTIAPSMDLFAPAT